MSRLATVLHDLPALLDATARLHRHLCPRQVLGVRLGLAAAAWLDLPVPQVDKRLLAVVETDGCFSDGVAVATNCWVGRRTMRVEDFGKVAVTLVDTVSEQAVRAVPRLAARGEALAYAPEAADSWHGQLLGYQRMPVEALLVLSPVRLRQSVAEIVSQPGLRVSCAGCGEEIMNGREVVRDGKAMCRACAGEPYYWLAGSGPGET